MEEQQNIEENPEDIKSGSAKEVNENTLQEQAETTNQKSEIQKPEIENMEVHHHPDLHHKKKHWKDIFWNS
jgi:hypothetical protein